MKQPLPEETLRDVFAQLGADQYNFDAWNYRVLSHRGVVHFGYSREFDRWANSVDLVADTPTTVENLKALIYWVCTRGIHVPRVEGPYFICRREVQRVWKQLPPSVRVDFRAPPVLESPPHKKRQRRGVPAPRFRDMPQGRNKISLRGRIPI